MARSHPKAFVCAMFSALCAGMLCTIRARAGEEDAPEKQPIVQERGEVYIGGDEDVLRALEHATELERQQRWTDVAAAYQSIIGKQLDEDISAFVPERATRLHGQVYISAAEECRRRLAKLPPEGLEIYLRQTQRAAQAAFHKALAARDARALADVAQRYTVTESGGMALAALGDIHFERGEFDSAARCWAKLSDLKGGAAPSTVAIKLAYCRALLGDAAAARALLQKLPDDAEVDIAGRRRAVRQIADALPQAAGTRHVAAWPAVGGNSASSAAPAHAFDMGRALWHFETASAAVSKDDLDEHRDTGMPLPRIHYPIVAGGRVYVNTGIEITCLDLAGGEVRWRYAADQRREGVRDLVGGGVVAGSALYAAAGGALVALDCVTGEVLWRTTAETDPIFREDALITQPVVVSGSVFAGVTGTKTEGESFLVALDPEDGSLIGKVFLESHSRPRHLGLGALGSIPSGLGGVVVYCSNLGTVAAVDARTLEVNWLWQYPYSPPSLRDHRIEKRCRWAVNPPVLVGDRVVVAPQDSHWLYVLDLASGTVLWRQPRRGARYVAAPAGGGKVFTFGSRVCAIDLATGKLLWVSQLLEGELAGRPVAGLDALLVPMCSALYRFDARDGTLLGKTIWLDPLDAGNLCIAGGRLVAGTLTGAAAFESWEQSQRTLDSDDPWYLLKLARLRGNKGQPDKAVLLFKKSRRLAGDVMPGLDEGLRAAYEMLAEQNLRKDPKAALEYSALALKAASLPSGKVRLLMRLGELLAQRGDYARAVQSYQLVLTDYPDEFCEVGGALKVRAAIRAQKEIEKLIARHGEEIYARQEREAAELLEGAAGFVVELEKVARYYPNSEAALEAAEGLALSRLEAGLPDEAADCMQRMADTLPERRRPGLLRRFAELMVEAERPDLACAFLRQLMRDHPDAKIGPHGATAAEYCKEQLGRLGATEPELLMLPLGERWRSPVRLSSATPRIFVSDPGPQVETPFGRRTTFFVVHSDGPRWEFAGLWGRSAAYDYIECRTAREGYLLWARSLPRWDGSICFSGGCALVVRNGVVRALDAATGAVRWRYATEGGERDFKGIAAAAGEKQQVYVCTSQGKVLCVSDEDGGVVWEREIGEVFVLNDSLTVLDDSIAVFSENPAGIYVLDKRTGNVVQNVQFDFPHTRITNLPLYMEKTGLFAVPVSDRMIAVVEPKTGNRLWHRDVGFAIGRLLASPAGGQLVVLPDRYVTNGKLQVVSSKTGQMAWEREMARDTIFDAAVDSRGVFLLERWGRSERLRAFSLATGEKLFDDVEIDLADLRSVQLCGAYILMTGDRARPRAVLLDRRGHEVFAERPGGAEYLWAATVDGTLVVASDRGTFGYGRVDAAAAAWTAAHAPEPAGVADLLRAAQCAVELKDVRAAGRLLAEAMRQAGSDSDYLRIYDRLSGIRDRLHETSPPAVRCVKMDRPPEIDGILADDWNENACLDLRGPEHIEVMLPGPTPTRTLPAGLDRREPGRARGENDISLKVYTGWDDKNFYIAVDVTDRTHRVIRKEEDDEWIGDLLIIGIDGHNDGGYGYGWGDYILSQGLMDKPKDDQGKEDEPEGDYSVKLKEDHSGVVYESSIPWTYLREIKAQTGTRFGLGVTVTDDDGEGVTKSISWTPGMYLHKDPMRLGRSFTPELLGDILLALPQGYHKEQSDTPERDEDQQ